MEQASLIVTSSLPDGELKDKLATIQAAKFEEALKNLVTGKTPKSVVYQKPMGRDKNGVERKPQDYVPGWWFVEQLNSLFGHFWDFEIIREYIGEFQIWALGKLTVKSPDNSVSVTKYAYGGSRIKSKENPAIDIGDDLKSAATDSLKKAATLLGIASDIYGKREILESTAPRNSQLDTLYKQGEKLGWNKSQTDEWVKKAVGVTSLDQLEAATVLKLIGDVRTLVKEQGVK